MPLAYGASAGPSLLALVTLVLGLGLVAGCGDADNSTEGRPAPPSAAAAPGPTIPPAQESVEPPAPAISEPRETAEETAAEETAAEETAPAPTPAVDDAASPTPVADTHWTPPPRLGKGGTIGVRAFNRFIKINGPPWAQSPLLVALEFLQLGTPEAAATMSISLERLGGETPTRATAEVITGGFLEDSVAAQRFELSLKRRGDGSWRVSVASWTQRCHAGRGQQTFTPDLCV